MRDQENKYERNYPEKVIIAKYIFPKAQRNKIGVQHTMTKTAICKQRIRVTGTEEPRLSKK